MIGAFGETLDSKKFCVSKYFLLKRLSTEKFRSTHFFRRLESEKSTTSCPLARIVFVQTVKSVIGNMAIIQENIKTPQITQNYSAVGDDVRCGIHKNTRIRVTEIGFQNLCQNRR